MHSVSHTSRERLTKVLTVLTGVATILSLSGVAYLAPIASAVTPADFGLKEGDVVSAAGSDDPDVYIVNESGYKRLFLNPAIFGFYGHLGGFGAVKNVSPATRDAFGTSGLFRNCETNDPKVYGVETTGEDTGMLHWVNTSGAQAVADDPNFFLKVFCINNNEFSWYSKGTDYTSVNQVPNYSRQPGQTPGQSGSVMASLSSMNPVSKTVTPNAYGVGVMAIRLSGNGTVTSLSFKRQGPGATGDYDNLYLYDGARRLTGGRTPSSSDGTLSFNALNVPVGGSKDIWLVADYSGSTGNVNYWEFTGGTLTSGNLTGAPLMSNNFTIGGTNSGTVTVEKSGSVSNPKVGARNALVSDFKVTANTEAGWVRRIQLFQGGNVKSSDITNLRLEVNGTQVATGYMTEDSYAVFDFGTPGYKIEKGDNRIFKLYADINGRKDETIKFYVDERTDVNVVGDQYGFGMAATITSFDSGSSDHHALTLEGGALTISFNGPTATNVGTDTADTILAEYSFTAASNIEARRMKLVLCWDDAGNGTFDAAADTTDGLADVEDIKVIDKASGAVVIGPADGSSFTDSDSNSCPDSVTGAAKTFTDTFDLPAGVTRVFQVKGDVQTTNGGTSTAELTTGDVFKVVLQGYGDLVGTSGDISVMKYSGTNTAVDDGDIVPNSDLSANNMTVQSSALTLGLGASPTSRTYVKGTSNVDVVGFTAAASLASDLKVTDVTLTGYVDDTGGTYDVGVASGSDASLSVGNLVAAVMLYDGDTGTLISNTPSNNNLNSSTGTIRFNNLNWVIPAGSTKNLLVRANLSSNPTSSSSDFFSFDINATTDITALDNSSNTVNAGSADPNGSTSPTVEITVGSAGTLTTDPAPANPITEAKYWGQTDTEFSRYRIRSTNEGFFIEEINLKSGDTAADVTANVDKVKLQYTNQAGTTLTAIGTLDSSANVNFGFTGVNRPYVPKDSSVDIIVLANMKTKSQGATSEVNFSLDFDANAAGDFRAVGEGSGTVLDGSSTGVDDETGNNHYVYRVFPKITQESISAGEPLGTKDVLKFTVKAEGLSDAKLLFNDPSSVSLGFEAVASGGADSSMTFNLYDVSTGELLASTTASGLQITPSINSSVTFSDWERDFEIQGGTSKTFRVETGFVNFTGASDYFQLVMRDEAGVFQYVDGARTGEDQHVSNVASVFRLLPMLGSTFTKN